MINYGLFEKKTYAEVMDTYEIETLVSRRKEHLLMLMYAHKDDSDYI